MHREKISKCKRGQQGGFSFPELMIVMAVGLVIAGMAIPQLITIVQNLRTGGDARDLNSAILLAKMRASADYAKTRVYADLSAKTFEVDVFPSGGSQWTSEGGTQNLSANVTFGYGSLTTAPSGMTSLAQAPVCLKDDMTSTTSNTACIMFNSRGIPIDNTFAPTSVDALYVTDGRTVTGVTVSVTGLTKVLRWDGSSAGWIKQ